MHFPTETTVTNLRSSKKYKVLTGSALISTLLVIAGFYLYFLSTASTNSPSTFTVEPGATVRSIAKQAAAEQLVRSDLFLYALLTTRFDPTAIQAGQYTFSGSESVFSVAEILATTITQEETVAVTFPEGITIKQMSVIAASSTNLITAAEYLSLAADLEGQLFPETYFIPKTFTAADLINLQKNTLKESLEPLMDKIENSALSLNEILILASIIEREANDQESMRMVSGILQNRLAINMPLQADATIEYVLDTPLNELPAGQLAVALRDTQSPYNTYKNTGLPPTPIGNPGIMAIEAALSPTSSEYFFYITGTDGIFHYAKTLAQHNRNVQLYLR